MNGGNGKDLVDGGAGNDNLFGANGNDTLFGDGEITFDDHGTGGSGPIIIVPDAIATYGGVGGNDTLNGGDGDDFLYGGVGNDTMKGDKGNDTFYGGTGNDIMTGGQGNDRFVIEANSGADRVSAYDVADKIVFDVSSGVTSFSGLTITASGGQNTLITWGTGGDSLLLEGIKAKDVSAALFQFNAPAAGFEHSNWDFSSHYAVPHDLFV